MRKAAKKAFLIVCAATAPFCANAPLESNYEYLYTPLLLFNNSSLLADIEGAPVSAQVCYPPSSKQFSFKTAAVIPFQKNAFSIGYLKNDQIPHDNIAVGFGHRQKAFSFGSTAMFGINTSGAILSIDGSASYRIRQGSQISLIGKNILSTDTVSEILPFSIGLAFSGPLPLVGKYLGYDAGVNYEPIDIKTSFYTYGGSLWFRGAALKNPSLHVSTGLDLFIDRQNVYHELLGVAAGVTTNIGYLRVGLFGGYSFDLTGSNNGAAYGGIYFNPLENRDTKAPEYRIDVSCSSGLNPTLFISIRCTDNDGSGLKQWTTVISSVPSKSGKLIKSFSGGQIPPSTISWDYRDNEGKNRENEKVYVRFIAIDNVNNIAASPWYTVAPCPQSAAPDPDHP